MKASKQSTVEQRAKRKRKAKQVLARLKIWLLSGKSITSNIAQREFKTSRLAAYIYRLRKKMDIVTEIVYSGSDQYAVYYTPKKRK